MPNALIYQAERFHRGSSESIHLPIQAVCQESGRLLGPDFQTAKPSERRRRELARINRILLAAAALEQG